MGPRQFVEESSSFRITTKPFYVPIADEVQVFESAWAEQIPILLKGPTGGGKTRFVEFMAYYLGQKLVRVRSSNGEILTESLDHRSGIGSLYTVACHEDLTARDLTGRFLMKGGETVWVDGPATMAVRQGAILYLDEIVEARKDVAVIIHPLTDYRRMLPLEAQGVQLSAPKSFMVVVSYNPGYQSIRKNLKQSTKQRFVAIHFFYPPPDKEARIVEVEGAVDRSTAERLVVLANDIRNISTIDLEEGVSTRSLISAARLIKRGVRATRACAAAIAHAISDEKEETTAIELIIERVFR